LIIGISAKAGSGKTEFARVAKEEFGAQIVPFAGALKEEVIQFLQKNNLQFRLDNIYGKQIAREELINIPLECLLEEQSVFKDFGVCENGVLKISYRTLLQIWGTEYRRSQDDQYWIKRALEKCSVELIPMKHQGRMVYMPTQDKLFIIDDLRFENEAEALMNVGAKLIRVERPNNPNPISNPWHPSECSLDEWIVWDYIIENSSDVVEFYRDQCRLVICEILGYGIDINGLLVRI